MDRCNDCPVDYPDKNCEDLKCWIEQLENKKSPIQDYYDTENNFVLVRCFWDTGFEVCFGDVMNGFKDIHQCNTWKEVEEVFKNKLDEIK